MFDDILQIVKDHLGNHPQISGTVPDEHMEAVHNEIASHIANNLSSDTSSSSGSGGGGMLGGLLQGLEAKVAQGGTAVSAIEGSLINSLTSKFGLPPSVTGAIAGALPGLLQKIAANKQKN